MQLQISLVMARTSTIALTNVTLPYIKPWQKGFRKTIADDEGLRQRCHNLPKVTLLVSLLQRLIRTTLRLMNSFS